jgi:hypothetical protein
MTMNTKMRPSLQCSATYAVRTLRENVLLLQRVSLNIYLWNNSQRRSTRGWGASRCVLL